MFDDEQAAQTDPTDRVNAAVEAWNADSGAPPAEEKPPVEETKPAAETKPAEETKTEEKPAEAAGDDSKLPYFQDKRFQEIYGQWKEQGEQLNGLIDIFTKGPYTIDNAKVLQDVLNDSFLLYDIAGGKKGVGELLGPLEKKWKPEQAQAVFQQLADYAASKGVKPSDKATQDKPWEKDLKELKDRTDARERADRDAEVQKQRATIVDSLIKKINDLCVAAGFDPKEDKEEIEDYCVSLSAELGKNPKVVEQLDKGQFGEVERLFTLHHNKVVARAKRYGDRTLKAKQDKDKTIPKTPAGGAAPSGAAKKPAARDLRSSEGRTGAAMEEWTKGTSA